MKAWSSNTHTYKNMLIYILKGLGTKTLTNFKETAFILKSSEVNVKRIVNEVL